MQVGDIAVIKQWRLEQLQVGWRGMPNYSKCMEYFNGKHKVIEITGKGQYHYAILKSPPDHPHWHGATWSISCRELKVIERLPKAPCSYNWPHCKDKR